jgi:hypothetical protein|uniref:Uncharacterized protein n=1 Tax=viral metagenome TaxID=1070528 RepID=A0A6C0CBJ7_9ZZZZ
MQPKQVAGSCTPITLITSSIISIIYNNSAHRKAGGNNDGGNTNKRRIKRPNIKHSSSNITNIKCLKNDLKKKTVQFFCAVFSIIL